MGYYIREGLVEEHTTTLDMILDAIRKGKTISFPCKKHSDMSKMKYQFNKILRAAQVLPSEAGGRFVDLRTRVQVCEDWDTLRIVIKPKVGSSLIINASPAVPDEGDMLTMLEDFDGTMALLEFTPSNAYSLDGFKAQIEARGFELGTHVMTGEIVVMEEEDKVMMTANRKRAETSSIMQDLGFGRTP